MVDKNSEIVQTFIHLEYALCSLDGLIVACKDYNLKQCLLKIDNNLYHVKNYFLDNIDAGDMK